MYLYSVIVDISLFPFAKPHFYSVFFFQYLWLMSPFIHSSSSNFPAVIPHWNVQGKAAVLPSGTRAAPLKQLEAECFAQGLNSSCWKKGAHWSLTPSSQVFSVRLHEKKQNSWTRLNSNLSRRNPTSSIEALCWPIINVQGHTPGRLLHNMNSISTVYLPLQRKINWSPPS